MNILFLGSSNTDTAISKLCQADGHRAVFANCIDEMQAELLVNDFQAVVVRLNENTSQRVGMMKQLRFIGMKQPVVAQVPEDSSALQLRAVSEGAVSVAPVSIPPGQIIALVQRLHNMALGAANDEIVWGELTVCPATRRVIVDGKDLNLTFREFQMLELLVGERGGAISKDRYLNYAYGAEDAVHYKSIDVLICKIRRKLRDVGASATAIRTHWGYGYSLCLDTLTPASEAATCPSVRWETASAH